MAAVAIPRQLTGHIAVLSRGLVCILNDDLYNATLSCLVPLASGERPPGYMLLGWCGANEWFHILNVSVNLWAQHTWAQDQYEVSRDKELRSNGYL